MSEFAVQQSNKIHAYCSWGKVEWSFWLIKGVELFEVFLRLDNVLKGLNGCNQSESLQDICLFNKKVKLNVIYPLGEGWVL